MTQREVDATFVVTAETSHSRVVPSVLALATVLPSGEKATLFTLLTCPAKLAMSLRLGKCQSLTSQRSVPTIHWPSGEKATLRSGASVAAACRMLAMLSTLAWKYLERAATTASADSGRRRSSSATPSLAY